MKKGIDLFRKTLLILANIYWVLIICQLLYQAVYKHDLNWFQEMPLEVGKHSYTHLTNQDVEL